MARTRTAVVKVMRGFGPEPDSPVPAVILTRQGKEERQYLSRETTDALGQDMAGYFEAEKIDGRWWIGQRLPDADRGW